MEEKKIKELAATTTKQNVSNVQVKPIIETVPPSKTISVTPASTKMSINDNIEDLLR